ncbi:MAG: GH39 family glycosyl hydrolase [Bacteroidales bacterium]
MSSFKMNDIDLPKKISFRNCFSHSFLYSLKSLILIGFLSIGVLNAQTQKGPLTIDVKAKGDKFEHFWSKCVGAGRANEGLRASWLEQLKLVKDNCGFEYCRFHGLFNDEMFVYKVENGNIIYNWQYIDELFDRMLNTGVRPFVELSFFPKDLAAKDSKTVFWWNGLTTPDEAKFPQWAELVKKFTQHCVDRYGMEEVKSWYFEVWNEPNITFFDGTKSQYFELYKITVNAVKSVNPALRVGGPSTSAYVPDDRFAGEKLDNAKAITAKLADIDVLQWEAPWVKDFLTYCKKENLPVDFISTHPYPTDFALDLETNKGVKRTREKEATFKDLTWANTIIRQSAYPNAEIHLTEWNTSPSPRDFMHDYLPAATYIVKANTDCIGLVNSLSYWTFTDIFEENGAGNTIYHGGFGMINFQGIVKPSFHAYRMLNELGDVLLYKKDGIVITRNSKTGKLAAIVYNYPTEQKLVPNRAYTIEEAEIVLERGTARTFSFNLKNLKSKSRFYLEVLDAENGNPVKAWKQLNCPETPSREQVELLKQKARTLKSAQLTTGLNGQLNFSKNVSPWSIMLLKEL